MAKISVYHVSTFQAARMLAVSIGLPGLEAQWYFVSGREQVLAAILGFAIFAALSLALPRLIQASRSIPPLVPLLWFGPLLLALYLGEHVFEVNP
jgi:hypothetical protein